MLVLSRRINEVIIIDGIIRVTVIDILRGKVRIGIDAPDHIEVNREEVQLEIDERKGAGK